MQGNREKGINIENAVCFVELDHKTELLHIIQRCAIITKKLNNYKSIVIIQFRECDSVLSHIDHLK